MQKWEYLVLYRDGSDVYAVNEKRYEKPYKMIHPYLEQLGKEGWELVSVDKGTLYFKRPIEE